MPNDDNHFNQARDAGGRFGHALRKPADVSLDSGWTDADARLHADARTATGDDIEAFVTHEDREVRMSVLANPHLTGAHIRKLAEDEDWQVRHLVAQLPYGGIGELMADDDDPIVRSAVLDCHDLTHQTRTRLAELDPSVRRIRGELANWG